MADPVTIFTNIAIAAATSAISNALAPKQKFEGPRLDDLRVQTSTYGKFRPIPFGAIAYAGNVFWLENNKLKETKHKESTGKGGPKTETTTYTYSATLAVGLGEGPIDGISKIWADNVLIYDKTDSATVESVAESESLYESVTVYLGTETQEVNARMEAEDAETPAYRGEAYIVIEDFQLEKFGNRIPNFTFLVVESGTDSYLLPDVVEDGSNLVNKYSGYVDQELMFFMTPANHSFTGDAEDNPKSISMDLYKINGEKIGLETKTFYAGYDGSDINFFINAPVKRIDGFFGSQRFKNPQRDALVFYQKRYGVYRNYGRALQFPDGSEINDITVTADSILSATDYHCYNSIASDDRAYVYAIIGDTSQNPSRSMLRFRLIGDAVATQADVRYDDTYDILHVHEDNGYVYILVDAVNSTLRKMDADLNVIQSWTLTNAYNTGFAVDGDRFVSGWNNDEYRVLQLNDDGTTTTLGSGSGPNINDGPKPGAVAKSIVMFGDGFISSGLLTSAGTILSDVVTTLSEKAGLNASDIDVTALTDTVLGYVVTSLGSMKSAIEPLQIAYQFDALESEYKLKFVKRGGSSVVTLSEEDLAAHEFGQERGDELPVVRGKESELPRETKLTYISLSRDYESDIQSASRLITESEQVNEINLPVVLSDAKAAQVAEIAQTVSWIERNTYPEFSLPYKYSYLEPSDVITVNLRGVTHKIRITQTDLGNPGILKCSGVAEKTSHYTSTASGVAGQASTQTLGVAGPTKLIILDLPMLRYADNDSGPYFAMSGYYSKWPGAALLKSTDSGETYAQAQSLLNGATVGYVTATPTTGGSTVVDDANTLNVKLYNDATLSSVTKLAMLNGANAAAVGADGRWAIIKFQTATLESDGSYTLSSILWGYHGTEHNISTIASGDDFVLLTESTIGRMIANNNEIGVTRHYKAVTFGKNQFSAQSIEFANTAESLIPLSPVHILGSRDGSNNLTVTWVRRTRFDGEWRDVINPPVNEESEAYEIDFTVGGTTVTKTGVTSETYSYTAAAQTTDFGSPQSSIITNIYQISATVGRGHAGTQTL